MRKLLLILSLGAIAFAGLQPKVLINKPSLEYERMKALGYVEYKEIQVGNKTLLKAEYTKDPKEVFGK